MIACLLTLPMLHARGEGGGGGRGGEGRAEGNYNHGDANRSPNGYNHNYSQEYNHRTDQQNFNNWVRDHEVLNNSGYGGGYDGGGYYIDPYANPAVEFPNDPQSNNYFNDPNWPNVQPGDDYNNANPYVNE